VDELIARLSDQFKMELPGWNSHQKMMNYKRPKPDNIELIDPDARESAVLALLYPYKDEIYTVLMQRHVYEGTHSGQISFPGGKRESLDKDLRETALREANEELAIDKSNVNIIGELTKVYIPPSRFLVSPFLGYVHERPNFVPEASEVSEIIEVPISQFLDAERLKEKYHFIPTLNSNIKIRYFDIDQRVVWGATAMMLSEISELLKKTDLF
jgi:8-oxo-dGTP pyrophosphatase MutT (NUDIX family)